MKGTTSSEQVVHVDHHQPAIAGKVLSFLFFASGIATLLSLLLPEPEGFDGVGVAMVGIAAMATGLVAFFLPWNRWSLKASLWGMPIAMTLISIHNVAGGSDPYRYGLFYLVAFVWLGMFQRQGTALRFLPLLVPSYLGPLYVSGSTAIAYASAAYAIPIYVMVAEVLAWKAERVRELQERLSHQVLHDALTSLPNRRLLYESLNRSLARATRTRDTVGLLYIDLDGFKRINDLFGHSAGDDLLVEMGAILRRVTRATDMPARLAGDEFVVLVDGDVSIESLGLLAERISEQVDLLGKGLDIPIGASIGFVVSDGLESADEILSRADASMYLAKNGRSQNGRSQNGHSRSIFPAHI